ncbi:TRAP transporter, DctM subunit [Acetomicrobium mobile DSM 13181]|uniref:TRAP transporter, DctM subunit n=1 Tax=Acetomicrobium mobile (strain ATCC BAA-54 / DSM 13181 / JCM 12221 / NGA) TaxID=891968 RepID=I4BX90_ACEMN|nr:TRAP transporter large permease [Acetomicrobium mobile]AFM21897.1 TRAP transporter, DctM subunit [Acetomicrobium mobile DSM 13181]
MLAITMFIILLVGLVLGVPIVVSLGLATIFPGILNPGFVGNISFVVRNMVNAIDSTPILAIPLFILSGDIMTKGKISDKLFDFFAYFIGNKTAGMPITAIVTCLFYGAISGSGVATTAAVGGIAIPFLVSLGYDAVYCAALVATAGSLGVIIPPSIPFVTYGVVTGVSVGHLFIAGIFPGILIGLSLMVYAYIYAKRKGENRELILAKYNLLKQKGFPTVFKESFWAILSPVIILGGIYSGVFTPTEAAVVSVFYSLLVCMFVYKTLTLKDTMGILKNTVKSYTPIVILLSLAIVFGRVLALLQAPASLRDFVITYFAGNKLVFLLVLNIIFFILGMFMDVGPVIAILAPMLLPVAVALGVNPIHLGIIMTCNLAIGMVTPPFGVDLFVAAPLIKEDVMKVGIKAIPFIISFIVALLMITYIPQISLMLLR